LPAALGFISGSSGPAVHEPRGAGEFGSKTAAASPRWRRRTPTPATGIAHEPSGQRAGSSSCPPRLRGRRSGLPEPAGAPGSLRRRRNAQAAVRIGLEGMLRGRRARSFAMHWRPVVAFNTARNGEAHAATW
jgi:hypothetical protein